MRNWPLTLRALIEVVVPPMLHLHTQCCSTCCRALHMPEVLLDDGQHLVLRIKGKQKRAVRHARGDVILWEASWYHVTPSHHHCSCPVQLALADSHLSSCSASGGTARLRDPFPAPSLVLLTLPPLAGDAMTGGMLVSGMLAMFTCTTNGRGQCSCSNTSASNSGSNSLQRTCCANLSYCAAAAQAGSHLHSQCVHVCILPAANVRDCGQTRRATCVGLL